MLRPHMSKIRTLCRSSLSIVSCPESKSHALESNYYQAQTLLPDWHSYSLHPRLLRSLHAKQYLCPTPIQSKALPFAMANRDVVGVAETVSTNPVFMARIQIWLCIQGSGKTLAYGLPILHYLLSQAQPSRKTKRRIRALILAPTRELALQVSSHLNMCLHAAEAAVKPEAKDTAIPDRTKAKKHEGKGKETENHEEAESTPASPKRPPLVSIAAIVGGMSTQKQHRILDRGVDVLVATPGRLWDILEDVGVMVWL